MDNQTQPEKREVAKQESILIKPVKNSDLDAILGRRVSVKEDKGRYERTGVLMVDPLHDRYIVVVCARTPHDFEGSLFYLPLSLGRIESMKISGDGETINLATNIRYATGFFDHRYDAHMGKIKKQIRAAR